MRGLARAGVRHLVTLSASDCPPPTCIATFPDLVWTSVPVPEFRAPGPEALGLFFQVCEAARHRGEGVAVHCRQGQGRTGTCLAAYLMRFAGLAASEAIAVVRRARPGSIETRHQEEALQTLENALQ